MVGDRMDTDVLAGVEAGVETVLVLSGFTQPDDIDRYTCQPSRVVNSIADLIDEVVARTRPRRRSFWSVSRNDCRPVVDVAPVGLSTHPRHPVPRLLRAPR